MTEQVLDVKTLIEEKSDIVKSLETILSPLQTSDIEKILSQTELTLDEIRILTLLTSLYENLLEKKIDIKFIRSIIKNYILGKISYMRKSRQEASNVLSKMEVTQKII